MTRCVILFAFGLAWLILFGWLGWQVLALTGSSTLSSLTWVLGGAVGAFYVMDLLNEVLPEF